MVYFSVKHSYLYTIIKDIRSVLNLGVGQVRAPPHAHSNLIPRILSLFPFSKEEEKRLGNEVAYVDVGGHFELSKKFQQRFLGNLTASNRFSTTHALRNSKGISLIKQGYTDDDCGF